MANATFQYTNGFDLQKTIEALLGRLGWQQPTVEGAPVLDTTNKDSKSGRYFNDGTFHAIVSPVNIKASMEDPKATDAQINDELQKLQKAAILRALQDVFKDPEVISQAMVYERYPMNEMPLSNNHYAVGYEIMVASRYDTTVQVQNAVLYFDQDVQFTLFLFKDGQKAPVWQQTVQANANTGTIIPLQDLYISYSTATSRGSRYYLVYFQDELGTARAIQEQVEDWNKTTVFGAVPFYAHANALNFDRNNKMYPWLPAGINLEISAFKDWTQEIIKKPALFDQLIGLYMAYMVIEKMVYAVRSNGNERVLKDQMDRVGIQLDLTGAAPISDSPKVKGLLQKIEAEVKQVKDAFTPKQKPQTVSLTCCTPRPTRWGLI